MPVPTHFTAGRRRLAGLRLSALGLGAAQAASPAEAVRRVLALQAQDLPGAKWSVGLRQAEATEAGVDAAFDAGEIVRSWPLRGTLHLVAAEDLPWLLQLTMPRATAGAAGRRAALGITEADLDRARVVAEGALAGRRALPRSALLAAIDAGGVSTRGQRGYHVLWHLAQTGTLVLGPVDGRQQMFARLDEWVPSPRRLDGDEALGELARRYFEGHGPATEHDLARWSGLALRDVRRGLAVGGGGLATIEVDGVSYLLAPDTLDAPAPAAPVHLLPGFDEYLLGYRDRTAALAPAHSQAIVPGGNGMFRPTIAVDGEVVGTWRRRISGREIAIEAAPFGRLSPGTLARLAEAAQAYGRFVGRAARLAPVIAGPTARGTTE